MRLTKPCIVFFLVLTHHVSFANEAILPILQTHDIDLEKSASGRQLFFDKRLSKNNEISCASCHHLQLNGADKLVLSKGVAGQQATLKTPTVYNAVFNISQTWSGARKGLYDQVDAPINHPKEHATSWPEVISKLNQDATLRTRFQNIYKAPISQHTIQDAIAEFERSLITTNAPFDHWLMGDNNAISAQAKQGYQLFKNYGCISCRSMFQANNTA